MRIIKLRKIKSVIATVLTTALILSSNSLVFASANNNTIHAHKFPRSTVITKNNLNEILWEHGIDPNTIIKLNKPVTNAITVGDLENAIAEAKQQPHVIVQNSTSPETNKVNTSTTNTTITAPSGTETVSKTTYYTNTKAVCYSITGDFVNGCWTKAVTSSFYVLPTNIPTTWYVITTINKNKATCYNGGTSDAYLQIDYDYVITTYYGVLGYGIPIGPTGISGYIRFSNSSI